MVAIAGPQPVTATVGFTLALTERRLSHLEEV